MSDDNGQLKAFIERILRMKEEARTINTDVREIYAEAKATGYDKTVMGHLVSYLEKREKGAAVQAEREALFETYLAAFDGVPRTRMRMPARGETDQPIEKPKQKALPAPRPKAEILPPNGADKPSGSAAWKDMLTVLR